VAGEGELSNRDRKDQAVARGMSAQRLPACLPGVDLHWIKPLVEKRV
jgi:hypothetical protein